MWVDALPGVGGYGRIMERADLMELGGSLSVWAAALEDVIRSKETVQRFRQIDGTLDALHVMMGKETLRAKEKVRLLRQEPLDEILRTLRAHDVHFVVIGNYGAILHGVTVETQDADMAYQRTKENLERLMTALGRNGHASPLGGFRCSSAYQLPRVAGTKQRVEPAHDLRRLRLALRSARRRLRPSAHQRRMGGPR